MGCSGLSLAAEVLANLANKYVNFRTWKSLQQYELASLPMPSKRSCMTTWQLGLGNCSRWDPWLWQRNANWKKEKKKENGGKSISSWKTAGCSINHTYYIDCCFADAYIHTYIHSTTRRQSAEDKQLIFFIKYIYIVCQGSWKLLQTLGNRSRSRGAVVGIWRCYILLAMWAWRGGPTGGEGRVDHVACLASSRQRECQTTQDAAKHLGWLLPPTLQIKSSVKVIACSLPIK